MPLLLAGGEAGFTVIIPYLGGAPFTGGAGFFIGIIFANAAE